MGHALGGGMIYDASSISVGITREQDVSHPFRPGLLWINLNSFPPLHIWWLCLQTGYTACMYVCTCRCTVYGHASEWALIHIGTYIVHALPRDSLCTLPTESVLVRAPSYSPDESMARQRAYGLMSNQHHWTPNLRASRVDQPANCPVIADEWLLPMGVGTLVVGVFFVQIPHSGLCVFASYFLACYRERLKVNLPRREGRNAGSGRLAG